jgi:hypothetical protein
MPEDLKRPPPPGYDGAVRRHTRRPRAERAADEARTADEVVEDPEDWKPNENDMRGVDTRGGPEYGRRDDEDELGAAGRQATMAPVHGDPSLDPVTTIWDIANMAGYGDGPGYDALDGVDRMVTGEADASRELRVESNTEGSPLDVGTSLFSDAGGELRLGRDEDPAERDWKADLRGDGSLFGGGFDWGGWL